MKRKAKGGSGIRGAVVLILVTVLLAIVPLPAPLVERWYSRGLYPSLQRAMTFTSGFSPVALFDVAVVILLLLVIAMFVRGARQGGWKIGARASGVTLLRITAIGYLFFLVVWGLNYRRMTMEEKQGFEKSKVTAQAALELASEAVRRLNALHGPAHATPFRVDGLGEAFAAAERATGTTRLTLLADPKPSALGLYMRKASFDGMTNPFFLEVILNPDLLDFEKPETLAHEWGHLAGYARESEASFLAWLTCLRGDPLAQYSGWMSAYARGLNALPRSAIPSLPRLDKGPRQDFAAIVRRQRGASPVVRTAARQVYDSYLKANRIEEGIANYDSVLQLMLGTPLGAAWSPK